MSNAHSKITQRHLERKACVYVRQSTMSQVLGHLESQQRQYELVERAKTLGCIAPQILVIDQDLGLSGADGGRSGFRQLVADVGLGDVGIILGLEVSRLARNNADWYQLLDLCAMCNTLIADSDGIYDPSSYNDRLLLGLKGTMSEAELHLIRSRMQGGLLHKAQKGELKTWLPVGYEYDNDDKVVVARNEAIVAAIQLVFQQFAALKTARRVLTWFRSEEIQIPVMHPSRGLAWKLPTYKTIHGILTNPIYAGTYVFGRTKYEKCIGPDGRLQVKVKQVAREEWPIVIHNHHEPYISWDAFVANQELLRRNYKGPKNSGSPQQGAALLQGLLVCGKCGRRMLVTYGGKGGNVQRYICGQAQRMQGAENVCQGLGGKRLDQHVARIFLDTVTPAKLAIVSEAIEQAEMRHIAEEKLLEKQLEKAVYEAERAKRQYDRVEPENRLVARTMEKAWEQGLREVQRLQNLLQGRQNRRYSPLTAVEKTRIHALGKGLKKIWNAPTTTNRDRKELVRTLIRDVVVLVDREEHVARCTIQWEGGAVTQFTSPLNRVGRHGNSTEEETVDLVRRLALHYPDDMIARILVRQHIRTGKGNNFNAVRVCSLRNHYSIPVFHGHSDAAEVEKLFTVAQAADELGVSTATVLRWLREGFIQGKQIAPGAPWQIVITNHLRKRLVNEPSGDWVELKEAADRLKCTRQTVLNRMRSGLLPAIYVQNGKRKGYRFHVPLTPTEMPFL
ncbi:recombinase family protein [Alicyclobacillus tolerans]|uniref:recombinase family protein n=1 Tax=Alicyclobacillus tolerans TaxID=90970 RepID=UPI001F2779E1|nr:recombinase family protein [Alicyclobacillus tolerans]MCF8568582.1 recombinase family protein [Alicyclobacillus tolerans]